jgi:serine carboxypeptidase-like clade I
MTNPQLRGHTFGIQKNETKQQQKQHGNGPRYRKMHSSLVGPYLLLLLIAVLVAIIEGALVVEPSAGTRKAPAATPTAVNTADADGDRVETLPLFGRPPSPQWSGYLNATALAEEEEEDGGGGTKNNNHNKKPLILWLNGGPGASSVVGMLQELGPLLINATGGLMRNPYSWTKVANILILESPVGVGYSYCARQQPQQKQTTTGKNQSSSSCINTDQFTASAARAALEDFFFYKFPHLFPPSSTTDFYLAGESYAGVYIPTLAHEILQFNQDQQQHRTAARDDATTAATTMIIPLKGILVGDPCTDNAAQQQSRDPLWYAHKNGLVDDAVYELLTQQCNVSLMIPDDNAFGGGGNDDDRLRLRLDNNMKDLIRDNPTLWATCTLAWRKFQLSSSRGTNGKWADRYIDHYNLFGLVDSRAQMLTERYMNRPDVRAALHIPDWLGEWTQHAPLPFDYQKQYAACNNNDNDIELHSLIDVYRIIVPHLRRTWIFNGDADPCISYEGTRAAVQRIGFNQVNGGGYRPWFYNETSVAGPSFLNEKVATFGPDLQATTRLGMQWGGHVMDYEHNLTFLTVHGSGHMVPMIRPTAALHLLTIFLQQKPSSSIMMAPLLLPDATLARISTSDFDDYLDAWINEAKELAI